MPKIIVEHLSVYRMQLSLIVIITAFSSDFTLAHDELYYPAINCKAIVNDGGATHDIKWGIIGARNVHSTNRRWISCPVPYARDVTNLRPVTVVVRVRDNTGDGSIKLRLCEGDELGNTNCAPNVQTSVNGQHSTLKQRIVPRHQTRWLSATIEIPDHDTQTGVSTVSGYRVCRGEC